MTKVEGTYAVVTCTTCNNHGPVNDIKSWHPYRHPFNGPLSGGDSESPQDDEPDVRVVRFPFDPVLRQALIDAGVVTLQQLRDAEEKIMAVTGQLVTEVNHDRAAG